MLEQACLKVPGESILSEELAGKLIGEFSDSNSIEALLKILQGNSLLKLSIFILREQQSPSIGTRLLEASKNGTFEEEIEKKKQRIENLSAKIRNLG